MATNDEKDKVERDPLTPEQIEKWKVLVNEGAPIRKLTVDERNIVASSVQRVTSYVPAFRDAIALMRFYFDATANTAYTDKYARAGLSPWFFVVLNHQERDAVILHETMHVLNNHFTRFDSIGKAQPSLSNIAGDLEINVGIESLGRSKVSIDFGVLPDRDFKFPKNKTLEQYYTLLMQDIDENPDKYKQIASPNLGEGSDQDSNSQDGGDSQGQSGGQDQNSDGQNGESQDSNSGESQSSKGSQGQSNSQGGGQGDETQGQGESQGDDGNSGSNGPQSDSNGDNSGNNTSDSKNIDGVVGENNKIKSPCDQTNAEREQLADEAGIERASEAERSIAKQNTAVRITEELNKKGMSKNGASHELLVLANRFLSPPIISWQSILRRIVGKRYNSISSGNADFSYRRPNRRRNNSEFVFPGMIQYDPKIMFGIDTSGSMGTSDYNSLLNEIEGIVKNGSKNSPLGVFSIDTDVKKTQLVKSVQDIKLTGGGGTQMEYGLAYVLSLPKRQTPDLYILATDGWTDWNAYEKQLLEKHKSMAHIILITAPGSFNEVPRAIKELATVIDISKNKDEYSYEY